MHTCMLLIKPQKLLEWPQKLKKGTNSKRGAKNNKMAPKAIGTLFGECLNYKSGLRILIWPLEVPFFLVRKRPLLPKVPIFETTKMALRVAKSKF